LRKEQQECRNHDSLRSIASAWLPAGLDIGAGVLLALSGPAVHTATCMYSNTPDEHFVLTRHPDCANVTVACGFSGHGFKLVPVVGEIVADLATTGATAHPIGLFDPRRLVTS